MNVRRYTLCFENAATRFIRKLRDPVLYRRISAALDALCANPYPPGCKKLQGRADYRFRVGDYRVVYRVLDREVVVLVLDIGDRKEIYR